MDKLLFRREPLLQISQFKSVDQVVAWMFDACKAIEANKMSYHFYPDGDSWQSERPLMFSEGYPDAWVLRYTSGEFRNCDPIPKTVMNYGKIMSWGEAVAQADLSEDEKAFIDQARAVGLIHGVGLPLWGPKECDGFVAVGFPDAITRYQREQVPSLQMLLQAAHQRICELVARDAEVPELSKRETEILTWVARGKSNSDIATILDLSPETVRTYLQRIFGKLGSRNRIGASIKALKLGLIRI